MVHTHTHTHTLMNMEVDLGGIFSLNSSYDYDEDYEYKEDVELNGGGQAVLIPVLYSVLIVVALAGNVLLLAVLAQKRRSWSTSDTFVLHLCVSDVLLLVTLPFWAEQAARPSGWPFGDALCKFSGAAFNINFYCGNFLLAFICLDCYLSVVHGTQLYFLKKPALAHVSCLLVWLVSLLLSTPDWISFRADKDAADKRTVCVDRYSQSGSDMLLSRLPHHTLGFLLPAAALIVFCSRILLAWPQRSKSLQKRGAITLVPPLVAVFFLCWVPYNVALIVDTFNGRAEQAHTGLSNKKYEGSLKTALMVTSALGCVHACLRPLLYLGLCRKFRKRMLALLRCFSDESESSLWELGVGEKARPDQSHDGEEQKQMTSVEQQALQNTHGHLDNGL